MFILPLLAVQGCVFGRATGGNSAAVVRATDTEAVVDLTSDEGEPCLWFMPPSPFAVGGIYTGIRTGYALPPLFPLGQCQENDRPLIVLNGAGRGIQPRCQRPAPFHPARVFYHDTTQPGSLISSSEIVIWHYDRVPPNLDKYQTNLDRYFEWHGNQFEPREDYKSLLHSLNGQF